ncbi:heavy-metal-associated domain-containing protein [Pseudomonas graminis]|uniref:Copper chaperone CopZ n=1 Tax=Pseudomonas graminis TaxID=158627 RepID=A0A6M8MH44_9PSED|nr:cation transporter [Pseudomonas graminis]QKF51186.1 Copper chaperone CopZ [Pseudomonas graminis]
MQVFKVQGMTCAHCVRAVISAIQRQDPTAQVQVDLGKGEVNVQSQLGSEQVVGLIEEEGYTATLV